MKNFLCMTALLLVLMLVTNFTLAAGSQLGSQQRKGENVPTIKLDVSVPPCKSINIEIFSFDTGLELKSFKVNGGKVDGMNFSSKKESARNVELKVRGVGCIELTTDTGFQWICLVVGKDSYPLPPLPPTP